VSFGEEGLVVDAIVPADTPTITGDVWVSLRAWHLLELPEPRILAIAIGEDPAGLLGLARWFAERLNAGITLLGVTDTADHADTLRRSLERIRTESGLSDADLHARVGDLIEQVESEQNVNMYDFIVLAAGRAASSGQARGGEWLPARTQRRLHRLGADVAAVIARAHIPIMVVRHTRQSIRKILICTAVGEPGKQDVRVGGRLARRMGATVTLLHVTSDTENVPALVRDHLIRAMATLRALDVPVETRILGGRSPARVIIDEARAGDYDLIVLGRLITTSARTILQEDVVLQVLLGANRPVLVVPFE
jgi:nucleotide-binding universal stress UspA family protein